MTRMSDLSPFHQSPLWLLVVCLCIALGSSCTRNTPRDQPEPIVGEIQRTRVDPSTIAFGALESGLQSRIITDYAYYRSDEPIPLTVEIRNARKESVKVAVDPRYLFMGGFYFDVFDSGGARIQAHYPAGDMWPRETLILPGDSVLFATDDLGKYYCFHNPGVYKIRFRLQAPLGPEMPPRSNELQIEVLGPPGVNWTRIVLSRLMRIPDLGLVVTCDPDDVVDDPTQNGRILLSEPGTNARERFADMAIVFNRKPNTRPIETININGRVIPIEGPDKVDPDKHLLVEGKHGFAWIAYDDLAEQRFLSVIELLKEILKE